MKWQGDGRDGGIDVDAEAAGERVDVREVAGLRGLHPFAELGLVAGIRREQGGETAYELGQVGHLRAGGGQLAEQRGLVVAELGGPGEQEPGDGPG